jgi:hypothetical protein
MDASATPLDQTRVEQAKLAENDSNRQNGGKRRPKSNQVDESNEERVSNDRDRVSRLTQSQTAEDAPPLVRNARTS